MDSKKTLMLTVVTAVFLSGLASAGPTLSFGNFSGTKAFTTATLKNQVAVDLLILGKGYFDDYLINNPGSTPFAGNNSDIVSTMAVSPPQTPLFNAVSSSGRVPGLGSQRKGGYFPGAYFKSPSPRWIPDERFSLSHYGSYPYTEEDDSGSNRSRWYGISGPPQPFGEPFPDPDGLFENPTPPASTVPAPGSIFLGGLGITIVGLLRNRKNR